ncbi:hypothetical protein V6N13_061718 [Hibiscus sabdariffa]|uniref:Uncharacterized protein n=1 Tax=Hibiscus sabdariffa TaxID=183260 RepID=A0ABR2BH10_9ROSI
MGTRTNNGVLVLRGGNVGLGFRLWESRARQAFCRRKGRLERPGPDRRNRVAATVRPWNEAWCRSENCGCRVSAHFLLFLQVLAQRVTSGDWYVVYGLISNRVRVQWWYDNEGSGVPSFGLNGEWMKAYGLGLEGSQGRGGVTVNKSEVAWRDRDKSDTWHLESESAKNNVTARGTFPAEADWDNDVGFGITPTTVGSNKVGLRTRGKRPVIEGRHIGPSMTWWEGGPMMGVIISKKLLDNGLMVITVGQQPVWTWRIYDGSCKSVWVIVRPLLWVNGNKREGGLGNSPTVNARRFTWSIAWKSGLFNKREKVGLDVRGDNAGLMTAT